MAGNFRNRSLPLIKSENRMPWGSISLISASSWIVGGCVSGTFSGIIKPKPVALVDGSMLEVIDKGIGMDPKHV